MKRNKVNRRWDPTPITDEIRKSLYTPRKFREEVEGEIQRKSSVEKNNRRLEYKIVRTCKERRVEKISREKRIELRDLVVHRAEAFAAFVIIAESKGLPAHVIDERRLAAIVVEERWDLVPLVLAWLIREDAEVKRAFDAFSDAARKCMENLRTGANKINKRANELVSEKYREMFLHAASVYARKLSTLESSLDRLSTLTLDELESLVADEDELSKRLATISMKISDEIKRREAKRGADAKDEKLDPVRQLALKLANDGNYPSRRQAVFAIKKDVIAFARTRGITMSDQQAEKTIGGWLKDLGYTPSASKQGTSAS